ncbi:hypothetical protein (mitochondrion) [Capsicum annuum]|uniref:Uncharacterized protein n=2 Tax=Capsicum annuum TaxID=4072 RepID=A0A075VWI6_CAPAN|nr:hypothetical protein [Capsicum annuum]YP_009049728.1 hypothetical protein [Capsicum annuum]QFV19560.1 hypothetical protein [Capsicum annuum var. glabriusculum]AIG89871.1 hypothetical protein [Capsicum annuum]AIG89976.1 hypothetical protein [Capsicum annuum]AIG90069.1 hypothetical protein [Capsicum annuum]AIG90085.1 hypothetical protein [Capsicum annuum]
MNKRIGCYESQKGQKITKESHGFYMDRNFGTTSAVVPISFSSSKLVALALSYLRNLRSLSTRRTSLLFTLFQVRIPVPPVPGYCIFPATLLQQELLSDLLPYHQDR